MLYFGVQFVFVGKVPIHGPLADTRLFGDIADSQLMPIPAGHVVGQVEAGGQYALPRDCLLLLPQLSLVLRA